MLKQLFLKLCLRDLEYLEQHFGMDVAKEKEKVAQLDLDALEDYSLDLTHWIHLQIRKKAKELLK